MERANPNKLLNKIAAEQVNNTIPDFRPGDSVKVHTRIVEGNKERIQIFEGTVLKRHRSNSSPTATFTVRKVSYGVGVERTFPLHSPRVAKIEVTGRGTVRRSRLFYLRPLRGKAAKIKERYWAAEENEVAQGSEAQTSTES